MYQAYIPGKGPYPALFPLPLVHPAPVRPGENFFPGTGAPSAALIAPTSVHNSAPILSIPSMAALRAKMERDHSSGCLNLVKKSGGNAGDTAHKEDALKTQQQSKLVAEFAGAPGNRAPGPAEFTRFTIDQILGKSPGPAPPPPRFREELASEEEASGDEIEVVRSPSPDSQSENAKAPAGRSADEEEDGGGAALVFGGGNVPPVEEAMSADDPCARFSWLQCTRYKPPKLPRMKKKDGVKKRKLGRNPRVPFTQHQVATLEAKFQRTHYLSSVDVAELSAALNLTETRVKIWFQNRRARERRERESSMQSSGGGGGQRSQSTVPRPDAQQLASELCAAQRLGPPGTLHPMSHAAAAAAAAALAPNSGVGPMTMSWPQLAMPPNPALIAHISHTLGSAGSAFRPVSFPT